MFALPDCAGLRGLAKLRLGLRLELGLGFKLGPGLKLGTRLGRRCRVGYPLASFGYLLYRCSDGSLRPAWVTWSRICMKQTGLTESGAKGGMEDGVNEKHEMNASFCP